MSPSLNRYYTCPERETAIFDTIIPDTTNNFDALASRFTCPVTGVYMFTLTIRNPHGFYARVNIMFESSEKAIISSSDGTSDHDHNQASNSVIEECQAGEHVWVRTECEADFGVQSGRHVIFSGFLVISF